MCEDLYKSWANVGALRMARILNFLKSKPLPKRTPFPRYFEKRLVEIRLATPRSGLVRGAFFNLKFYST